MDAPIAGRTSFPGRGKRQGLAGISQGLQVAGQGLKTRVTGASGASVPWPWPWWVTLSVRCGLEWLAWHGWIGRMVASSRGRAGHVCSIAQSSCHSAVH